MVRYIDWSNRESPAALEDRVRRLEVRVTALTEIVRVLVHGLEDLPTSEPGGRQAAEAARQAYNLLLAEPSVAGGERLPAARTRG